MPAGRRPKRDAAAFVKEKAQVPWPAAEEQNMTYETDAETTYQITKANGERARALKESRTLARIVTDAPAELFGMIEDVRSEGLYLSRERFVGWGELAKIESA